MEMSKELEKDVIYQQGQPILKENLMDVDKFPYVILPPFSITNDCSSHMKPGRGSRDTRKDFTLSNRRSEARSSGMSATPMR